MANPNLTKILFAGLIVTFVTTILILNYSNFAVMNGANIEEPYKSIFLNISSQQSSFESIGYSAKNQSVVKNILDFGEGVATGTVNVFVTGLQAMGTFFLMIPIWGNILSAISLGLPGLAALINLLILMSGIYIAMRYIQSVSNKNELP
jgi:hypothetical protein